MIRHHFSLPDLKGKDLGRELYRKPPWAIYQQNGAFIYLGISPQADDLSLHRVATFNADHTRARIYNDREDIWRKGDLHSLTMFPSDQILIARLLADRQGCYLHSAGAILDGAGVLFVGHSDAGKSTITRLLMKRIPSPLTGEGQHRGEWRVYGTWSHGTTADVSSASAPLRAILFLHQDTRNEIMPLTDRKEIWRRLLATLIRPMVTAEWWQKELDVLEQIVKEVRCYSMKFDKSGAIVEKLQGLVASKT